MFGLCEASFLVRPILFHRSKLVLCLFQGRAQAHTPAIGCSQFCLELAHFLCITTMSCNVVSVQVDASRITNDQSPHEMQCQMKGAPLSSTDGSGRV